MTARDVRIAVLQECAELADRVSARYGSLPKYGAGRVAMEIRELMEREMGETSPSEPIDEEPYL